MSRSLFWAPLEPLSLELSADLGVTISVLQRRWSGKQKKLPKPDIVCSKSRIEKAQMENNRLEVPDGIGPHVDLTALSSW